MTYVAVECFGCGKELDVGKAFEVAAWREDCLWAPELVCGKCDVRVRVEGTVRVTRGDEMFILRPIRHASKVG